MCCSCGKFCTRADGRGSAGAVLEPQTVSISTALGPQWARIELRNVTQILRAGSIWELLRRVPREWGPGGREYGRVSAHPERLLGGSLVTFWPSRKSLAPQGETL